MRYWFFCSKDVHDAARARQSLVEYLEQDAIPVDRLFAVELILGELLGNVVRHAPGPVEIELRWAGERPELRVHDEGQGFNELPATTNLLSDESSGRGLCIVRELATDLQLYHAPHDGMSVIATLPLTPV